jgi:hypothetical protein
MGTGAGTRARVGYRLERSGRRHDGHRARRVRCFGHRQAFACLLAVALLSGCSTGGGVGTLIIDPGHYSVYHCDGLATRLKGLQARELELSNLMQRASEGGGGALIGNLTYRADYENVLGEEALLRRVAAQKNCDLPPPPQPVSSTPAAYSATPVAPAAPATRPVYQSDQTIR